MAFLKNPSYCKMNWKLTIQMGRVHQTKYVSNFNVQTNHLGLLVKLQFCGDQMEPMPAFLTHPQMMGCCWPTNHTLRSQNPDHPAIVWWWNIPLSVRHLFRVTGGSKNTVEAKDSTLQKNRYAFVGVSAPTWNFTTLPQASEGTIEETLITH